MNNTKIQKIKIQKIILFFIITIICLIINVKSYATNKDSIYVASEVVNKVESGFKSSDPNDPELKKISGTILGYIQYIGLAIFVGSIIFYGIQLVSADASKTAEIKDKLILWVIAGVLIMGASQVVQIITDASKPLFG